METFRQIELLFEDGHQYVNADGNPHLRFDGIGRSAEKVLDAQVLLDPSEEQLYLPATFVQVGDRQGWQGKVVGQVASHTSLELLRVNRIENLNKNRSSYIHVASVSKSNRCKKQRVSVSNRSHISFDVRSSL